MLLLNWGRSFQKLLGNKRIFKLAKMIHPELVFARLSSSKYNDILDQHIQNILHQHENINQRLSSLEKLTPSEFKHLSKTQAEITPIVKLFKDTQRKKKDLEDLKGFVKEGGELGEMAELEQRDLIKDIQKLEDEIMKALIPKDDADENDAILEVRAGAGGHEASLFAFQMVFTRCAVMSEYSQKNCRTMMSGHGELTRGPQPIRNKFASYQKWRMNVINISTNDTGGYKDASASITGAGVFGKMKFEVGTHRVQRVPVTESMGRVHTSTMTVAVLPQPKEIDIVINPSDLKIETFRASGAGGQHVNKTDSAVRITHLPTGMVVNSQAERSQFKNKASALQVLRTRLYDIQRQQAASERDQARRSQIGTAERSEKIRTYNFPQDRVTDHRIGLSAHGIDEFLQGEDKLEDMINALRTQSESQAMKDLIDQYSSKEKS